MSDAKENEKADGLTTRHLRVHPGLEGFDEDLDTLTVLYQELQQSTADVADPKLDLLTFARTAHWFVVLTAIEVFTPGPAVGEGEKQKKLTKAEKTEQYRAGPGDRLWKAIIDRQQAAARATQESSEAASPACTTTSTSLAFNEAKPTGSRIASASTTVVTNNVNDSKASAAGQGVASQSLKASGWRARLQGTLSGRYTWSQYQAATTRSLVGLIYLMDKQQRDDSSQFGELNLGIIIGSPYRRRGHASEAIQIALEHAFAEQNCVRVQAVVIDGPFKHAAQNAFMKLGFGHEGTRRRAFRSPYSLEYKDVTCFGILATDWSIRHVADSRAGADNGHLSALRLNAPTSLWEEMFERHQREREELLRWEDKNNLSLKRTASSETIRRAADTRAPDDGEDSDENPSDSESADGSMDELRTTSGSPHSSDMSSRWSISDEDAFSEVESLSETGSEWEELED